MRLTALSPLRRRFQSSIRASAASSLPRHTTVMLRSSSGRASSSPAHFVQVKRRKRVVEGNDLHHVAPQNPVKQAVGAGALDAGVLAGQVDGLVVLDLRVVVVDPPDRQEQLARLRRRVLGAIACPHSRRVEMSANANIHPASPAITAITARE